MNVTLPDGTFIEYSHDPFGRRIEKRINDAVVEKYLWQGRTRLLAVYDKDDNLKMRFEYADGRMPVAMSINDSSVYYLTYDQVGSLRIVTDVSGNVVKKVDYDSFGNIILPDTNPAFEIPFGFADGLHDRDTGLVRFGFRDYDPDVGRWTAKDPIRFAGGDTDLYGYCLDDPINFTDTEGRSATAVISTVIGADTVVPDLTDLAWPKWVGYGLAFAGAALADWLWNENADPCDGDDSLDDYPADPDDWNPPDGWEETNAGEKTGGKHRQWKGPNGEVRRWDREGRESGKERGPHWHDPRYPGKKHIPPNR
ncbi:MAG: RHS repeat-associated core domain-containing protein [Desulfobacterales bacterium]|nr:RHS repeat-associated core domain-containing protein [Desulfobacterales bacterium]